jgi:hypothetical protein
MYLTQCSSSSNGGGGGSGSSSSSGGTTYYSIPHIKFLELSDKSIFCMVRLD